MGQNGNIGRFKATPKKAASDGLKEMRAWSDKKEAAQVSHNESAPVEKEVEEDEDAKAMQRKQEQNLALKKAWEQHRANEEAKRKKDEEEAKRRKAEEEARRGKDEEEAIRRKDEELRQRQQQEKEKDE